MTDVRDVGDWRQPTISISTADNLPAGGTVTCAVEDPDGTITSVAMTAGAATATATPWTGALYELTKAGEWIERFTITGDGKGKARQLVWVQADPGAVPSGMRVYATTGDYANSPYSTSVPDSTISMRRALLVASARIDELISTAIYTTDDTTLLPTDSAVATALRDATVAQAAYAIGTGDAYGLGVEQYQSVSVGGISLTRGSTSAGSSVPGRYAPQAMEILRAAGLTGNAPRALIWPGLVF